MGVDGDTNALCPTEGRINKNAFKHREAAKLLLWFLSPSLSTSHQKSCLLKMFQWQDETVLITSTYPSLNMCTREKGTSVFPTHGTQCRRNKWLSLRSTAHQIIWVGMACLQGLLVVRMVWDSILKDCWSHRLVCFPEIRGFHVLLWNQGP